MRVALSGEHKFWLGIGAVALLVFGLIFLWVIPTCRGAADAERNWAQAVALLNALKQDAANIPSLDTLKESGQYREWMQGQASLVEAFFADRTALLGARLTGEGDVTPGDFKEAYIQAVNSQREYLESNAGRMRVANPARAFRAHRWVGSDKLPDPGNYPDILRDYWARYYLYRLFLDARVRVVKKLDIGAVSSLPSEFDGLQFRAELSVQPARLAGLVEKMLTVSPEITSRPVFDLADIKITAEPSEDGSALYCSVLINGYILLQRQ